jgi:hypothetical protein
VCAPGRWEIRHAQRDSADCRLGFDNCARFWCSSTDTNLPVLEHSDAKYDHIDQHHDAAEREHNVEQRYGVVFDDSKPRSLPHPAAENAAGKFLADDGDAECLNNRSMRVEQNQADARWSGGALAKPR